MAGSAAAAGHRAPGFALTDQHGQTVTLASLRGKVVLLSFFDPACTPGCPPISRELRQAAEMLGGSTRHLQLVGIVLSPNRRSAAALRAFDRRAGLSRLPDWLFLTGSPARLQQVWREYGIPARPGAPGLRGGHGGQRRGLCHQPDRPRRAACRTGAAPETAAMTSSFAVLLADAARQALRPPVNQDSKQRAGPAGGRARLAAQGRAVSW